MMVFAAVVWFGAAYAQETSFDAYGFGHVAQDGDVLDPVRAWRAETQRPMSFGAALAFEYAASPLVRRSWDEGDGVWQEDRLLDHLVGFQLGAQFSPLDWLSFGLGAPIWLTSEGIDGPQGAAAGDLRLDARVGKVIVPSADGGFALAATPWMELPSGAPKKYLGSGAVTGGVGVAAGYVTSRFQVGANLGFEGLPRVSALNLQGGPRLTAALTGAWAPIDAFGLGLDLTAAKSFVDGGAGANAVSWTESPVEATLWSRVKPGYGLSVLAGGGAALTRGVGRPAWRLFAGIGWTFGKDAAVAAPVAEPANRLCPDATEGETVNGWRDDDGCPDALARLRVELRDASGADLVAIPVALEGREGRSDNAGEVLFADLTPGVAPTLRILDPERGDRTVTLAPLTEGENYRLVEVGVLPGGLEVEVFDANSGAPIDALLRFSGAEDVRPVATGGDGAERVPLPSGSWRMLVSADRYTVEDRTVTVVAGRTERVRVGLKPGLVDAQGCRTEFKIREKVLFDYDSSTIKPESFELLRQVALNILNCPDVQRIEVQGHTDSDGGDRYNLGLSQDRADSVMAVLLRNGVEAERLSAVGYGESRPIVSNETVEGKAVNRRVQFIVLDGAAPAATPAAPRRERAVAPRAPAPRPSPQPAPTYDPVVDE